MAANWLLKLTRLTLSFCITLGLSLRLIVLWLLKITMRDPLAWSSFNFVGIVLCHHLQPDGDLLHLLPMLGAISVSSRSKAAIVCDREDSAVVRDLSDPSVYLPIIRLLFTTLHDSLSGSFCEAGLKKLATALSEKYQYHPYSDLAVLTCSR